MELSYLREGDLIGICSPSRVPDAGEVEGVRALLEEAGYRVRVPRHILDAQWGYGATAHDRAADFNQLCRDDKVRLVLFGGGEGGIELLPLLDYAAVRQRPKLFCSFSDGTTILHALRSQCGIPVFYGPTPGSLLENDDFTLNQFDFLTEAHRNDPYFSSGPWYAVTHGKAEGTLVAGYLRNFVLLFANPYVRMEAGPVVLFLEDHEQFTEVGGVAAYLALLAMQPFASQVRALVFGHYSDAVPDSLLGVLWRFGRQLGIPVAYTDDFGHGTHHAVLPIGRHVRVDVDEGRLDWA